MIDGATGTRNLDATIPGGGSWAISATRARYRDRAGSAFGVRSIVIRASGAGVSTVGPQDPGPRRPGPRRERRPADGHGPPRRRHRRRARRLRPLQFNGGRCVKRGKKLTCR
jgi:hypothetical protein